MNAIPFIRTMTPERDTGDAARFVMQADMDLGLAQDALADMVEALFNERRNDPLRPALLAHIRDIQICIARSREAAGQMRQMLARVR